MNQQALEINRFVLIVVFKKIIYEHLEAFGERIQKRGRTRAKIREALIQLNTEVLISDSTENR